jgi:hypothetical protein
LLYIINLSIAEAESWYESNEQIARRDEEMAAYVPPLKRSYIFGGICSVSATAFIKVLALSSCQQHGHYLMGLLWVHSL